MNDYYEFKNKIQELVKAWNTIIKPGIEESGQYGETNTRKYLIDPILDALNWVDDGSKKIIDNEFSVKHKTGTGSADYALKVNGIPKILVEAKDVAKIKDLENGYDIVHGIKRTYPRQLSNYCHDLNHQGFDIKFSILTNGKEWIVYNMKYADISSEREIIFRLNLEELDKDENIEKLWALEYSDICGEHYRLREIIQQIHDFRLDIDKKAVQQLLECKDLLSNSIFNDYEKDERGLKDQIDEILQDKEQVNGMPIFQEIPEDERLNYFIKEASSSIINKILFIRILEDKNFLTPKLTKRSIEKWKDFFGYKDYDEIMSLFRESCRITEKTYNGGLFRLNPYDKVEYDPNIIKKIIDILGDINFREIDSDIIGRIYEIYLGHVLRVESEIHGKKRTKYKADNRERKKLGQYYTPKFIVDFIIQETLGKSIEGKKPEEISKIRILDPACGSGSFLINAYDELTKYFENWNNEILKIIEQKNRKNGAKITNYSDTGAVPKFKNIILKENLHGVDLNDLSVQICEINLWLRALERDKKLIKLNKNILHGNSLITGVENKEDVLEFKDELQDIKKRQHQIKGYYDENEIPKSEEKRLEALEKNLKFIKNNVNKKLNDKLEDYFGDNIGSTHPFNWEVEFPEVMNEKGFDVVIGNPPYITYSRVTGSRGLGKDYTSNLKQFYRTKYPGSAEYKLSTYAIFIDLGIKLMKNNGRFGFIVPDSFLIGRYFSKLRKTILDTCKIIEIVMFEEDFWEGGIIGKPVILILEKEEDKSKRKTNILKSTLVKNLEGFIEGKTSSYSYAQDYFYSTDFNRFRLFFNGESKNLVEKIEINSIKAGDIISMHVGIRPKVGYKNISSESKENNNYHKGIISGSEINRYIIDYQNNFINIEPKLLWSGGFNKEVVEREKLLMRKTGDSLIVAYDNNKLYHLDILHSIILHNDEFNLKYIMAVLNSKLMNFYYRLITLSFKRVMAQTNMETVEQLPIKKINNVEMKKLTQLVDRLLYLKPRYFKIINLFSIAINNISIDEPKSCSFGKYYDSYDLYNIKRETLNNINQIKGKIISLNVEDIEKELKIYLTYLNEDDGEIYENVEGVKLIIENSFLRKFLFFSIMGELIKKGKKGFGKGNLLDLIKEIYVPYYVTNAKMNSDKIKEVMNEFLKNTDDLWFKNESKKEEYTSYINMKKELEEIEQKIDESVYKLYSITDNEKSYIENAMK